MKTTVIAIDGYASTGKSTLSKQLAKHLGYTYVDTGYMFRTIGFLVLQNNWLKNDIIAVTELEKALPALQFSWKEGDNAQMHMALNDLVYGEELRTTEVSNLVSKVAALPAVRAHLLDQQRSLSKASSVVMDGRDIGTVVFPDAELKIFMTADVKVRAERRHKELVASGSDATLEEVTNNLATRDRIDSNREDSPLTFTDAYRLLDNSHLSPNEQLEIALDWVHEASINDRIS